MKMQKVLKCALILQPKCWEAHYLGAHIYHLQGRDDEAIERYKHYLTICPEDINANMHLGGLLRKRSAFAEAEKYCRKAVAINFYSWEAHYNLSNVLFDKGDQVGALAQLKICMTLNPNSAQVHNNIGVLYQKRGYLEEAHEEFIRALKLEPANKTFLKNLTLLRERLQTQPKIKDANAADML
jgi:Flp pilus assembly protein TadD